MPLGKGSYLFTGLSIFVVKLEFPMFFKELMKYVCTDDLYKNISDYIYKNSFPLEL